MKSKLFYSQFFGLLLICLFLLSLVPKYTKEIPKILIGNIEKELLQEKISWVSVRAEGRDIIVSGIAPSVEAHTDALKLVQDVFGVRGVSDKISPKIVIPYTFNLRVNERELILEGYMPSVEAKKELLKFCSGHYKSRKIIDKVDVASGNPSLWNTLILSLVKEMKKLDVALVNIVDNRAQISGKVKTQKLKNEFISSLEHFNKKYQILEHLVSMDEPIKVCQEQFDKLLKYQKIKFDIGKSTLRPESNTLILELVNVSSLCPQANLKIIGHTDSLGNNEANKKLSLNRSKAVVSRLFQEGVLLDRMHASGQGESEPIANNSTKEGRAKNRRIEFKVIMKEER